MKCILSRFSSRFSWQALFFGTVASSFLYVFLEWLFIITKPSSVSALPFLQKFKILLLSFSLVAGISLLFLLALMALSVGLRVPWLKLFGIFLPAGITASLALLLLDNFTYTLFKVGIATSHGIWRGGYLLLFFGLLGYFLANWMSLLSRLESVFSLPRQWIIPFLALVVVAAGVVGYTPPAKVERPQVGEQGSVSRRMPHILLITADGLDANHMSVYGYERDTTPFLRQLVENSLVAENAYSNSANTSGSIISILTGRYPTTTHVIYPPQILQGNDAYKHLPYILRAYGYKSIQYSSPYYVDAFALGIRDGFEYANGSYIQESPYLTLLKKFFDFKTANYIYELLNRIIDRLRHIFFVKEMRDFLQLIPNGKTQAIPDDQKIDAILSALLASEQPMFVHLHWIGTHGAKFHPKNRVFSQGKDVAQQGEWDSDFYDDAILDFDMAVARIVYELEDHDLIDHTILVIASDHGSNWTNLKRIPLIIRFPYEEHKGKVLSNVQLIDIAPTLLDYLDISWPSWFEGHSLLRKELATYPIFGAAVYRPEQREDGFWAIIDIGPPFYGFQAVSLISCDTWYRLDLLDRVWKNGKINGSTATCEPYTDIQAFELLIQHLEERGFDTSTIRDFSFLKKQ